MNKTGFYLHIVFMALALSAPVIVTLPDILAPTGAQASASIFGLSFTKAFFFKVQAAVVFSALIIYGFVMKNELLNPGIKLEKARDEILNVVFRPSLESFFDPNDNIRIIIHEAKRNWLRLGLWFKLAPIYRWGFERQNRDYHLIMSASKLFRTFKGNSGLAFIDEEPKFANLTEEDPFNYGLTKEEVKKTSPLKAIISIPIFEKPTGQRTPKAVGVISIDTFDEHVVNRWLNDEDRLKEIVSEFEQHAKLVSVFL